MISSSFVKCRDIKVEDGTWTFEHEFLNNRLLYWQLAKRATKSQVFYRQWWKLIGFLYHFPWSLTKVHGLIRQGSILCADLISSNRLFVLVHISKKLLFSWNIMYHLTVLWVVKYRKKAHNFLPKIIEIRRNFSGKLWTFCDIWRLIT